MKRIVILACVLAVMTAACSSKSTTTTTGTTTAPATTAANGPKTLNVVVDHKSPDVASTLLAYFPNVVTAHPGDTVDFQLQETGEPHTVTLGTLADAAITKSNPNDPNAPPPPEDAKLPNLFPQGPGDAIQSAAQPCYLPAGTDPPASNACTAAQQQPTDFDGTQSYYNSGWLSADKDFKVKIAAGTKPGTYKYMCLLHREGMSGTITVVAPAETVPSAADQAAKGTQQVTDILTKLKPSIDALPSGTNPDLGFLPKGPNIALAGSGAQAVQDAQINAFGPKAVSIPVGGSVSWIVFGDHTISFNAPESAKGARQPGTTHINQQMAAPAGGPGVPPPANQNGPPPTGPPPAPTIADNGAFDGTGFRSSGLVLSFPPALSGYKLTFTKAGTYTYRCLIHDNMEGTVKVG